MYYSGHQLLINSKSNELENVELEEEIDYNQVLKVLESSYANAIDNDFEGQLSILLDQVVIKDPERDNKINELCRTLEELFHPIFTDCKATAFGSAVTGLSFVGSDIDIVLWANDFDKTLPAAEDLVKRGTRLLFSHQDQFSKIIGITKAKIPIIKFVHIPTRMKCDVSFHNTFSVQNSSLIAFVISIDERIRKMMLFIKFWAQKHYIANKARLNNYTILLLVIFYLQQGKAPLLPAIKDLRDPQTPIPVNTWDTNFRVNSSYKCTSNNKELTENLVAGFFRFYAELSVENTVICPLLGLLIPRENFHPENFHKLPAGLEVYKTLTSDNAQPLSIMTPLCVQDPIELNHNVAHNVKVTYFQDLCDAVKVLLVHGPDGSRLPPITKLLDESLLSNAPKRISIGQNNLTLVLKSCEYLKKEYLGSYSVDTSPFYRWANIVINFIELIFQDIFKLEITQVKHVGAEVLKADNVHGQQNMLICRGTYDVYQNRKKFRPMVQGPHNWYKSLVLVSEKMIAMNEAPSIDLEFLCIPKADQKNDCLIVKLESLNKSLDFVTASTYISNTLLIWIDKAFKRGQALKYFSKRGDSRKILNRNEMQMDTSVVNKELSSTSGFSSLNISTAV